ncbi:uncharacterized protein HaLaN_30473, partial [Haematococcus lacustris]
KGAAAASLLLRLLIVWLVDCPLAVAALLEPASHLPLLVDLATDNLGASDATLMGVMGPGPDEVAGSGPWDWGFTQLVVRLEGE